MLQTIREHTQGWIAGTIITIIILTFALWGIHSYFVGGTSNNTIAEVNGIDITKDQLRAAYDRLRRQIQIQSGTSITSQDESLLRDRALQGLIDVEVLKQASSKEGFRISDRQIDNALQTVPEFQVNGEFSVERFQRVLSSAMLSTSEFLDLLRTSLLIDQPKLGILFTSFGLPTETAYAIALINQERDLDYLNIPLSYVLSQPITIANEQIQAYYNEHKNEFMTPEQVKVDYIELSAKTMGALINPSEETLKSFYHENMSSFSQPIEWKILDIQIPFNTNATATEITQAQKKAEATLQAIQGGNDFSKVAQGYSSAFDGSTWLTLSQIPSELQKDVAALKPGQLSKVIKTNNAFVILKVSEIKEPQILPFDVAKAKVKELYVKHQVDEQFAELRDRLADLTYEHPDSLQYAAKTLNLSIKTSEFFTKEKGSNQDISQSSKVRNIAFSNDVLNLQNNSDVIQLNPETALVIHINSHLPSAILPLNIVSKKIENTLKTKEADTRVQKFAEELRDKLQAGIDPQQLASVNKLSWIKTGFLQRYSNKVDSAILDMAFRLPNPAESKKVIYGLVKLPSGFALIALKGVKEGTVDKKQYDIFAEQVQNSEGLLEYELYKLSLNKSAKIGLNS